MNSVWPDNNVSYCTIEQKSKFCLAHTLLIIIDKLLFGIERVHPELIYFKIVLKEGLMTV